MDDTTTATDRPAHRQVMVMMTCLCDAFFPEAARATVEVLEHAGCEVFLPPDQTCCGQPAFNSGDFPSSRRIARHTARVFANEAMPVIIPSGSCAAMHRHGHPLQFEDEPPDPAVESLSRRSWELCDYLVHGLGIRQWPGSLPGRVLIHDACHTRGSRSGEAMRTLLGSIAGLQVSELESRDQCCGFGGTFSVTFSHISMEMGHVKLEDIRRHDTDCLVSTDLSCLMHLGGLAERAEAPLRTLHAVELLARALQSEPL